MEECYYQTKKEFIGVAWSIYITASCDSSDLQSEEYQQYICERVFANDHTHRLLWEMTKYNRGAKFKMYPHDHITTMAGRYGHSRVPCRLTSSEE